MAARPRVILKQFVKPTPPVDIEARKKSMTQWLHEESKKNPIVLKEAFDRNIIFVGPTRAGKSTVFEVLKDPFFFTQMGSIFSDTRDAKINHFTVEVPTEAGVANYNIAIIDTPGLFEVHAVGSGKETRDDEVLEDVILKCLNVEITKIHSIFFVFAYTGALNPNDIQALEKFIKLFSGAGQFIHMLITHAEALTDQRKEEIKAELLKVQSLAALINNTTARFHFSGAVDETYQKQGMLDVVQDRMTNVLNMRNELFEEIFAADQFFELNSIDKSGTLREKAIELMKKLQKELSSLPLENPSTFERQCRDLSSKKAVLLAAQRTECEEFLKKASDHLEYLQACRFLEQLPKDWQNQLQKSPLKFKYDCKEFFRLASLHLSGDQLAQASEFFTTIQEHWTPEP